LLFGASFLSRNFALVEIPEIFSRFRRHLCGGRGDQNHQSRSNADENACEYSARCNRSTQFNAIAHLNVEQR
jgi:hypothetical protein